MVERPGTERMSFPPGRFIAASKLFSPRPSAAVNLFIRPPSLPVREDIAGKLFVASVGFQELPSFGARAMFGGHFVERCQVFELPAPLPAESSAWAIDPPELRGFRRHPCDED